MIFVMIFETLQHGILANEGAKSALKLEYQKALFSYLSIIFRRPPGSHKPMSPVCNQPSSSMTSLLQVFKYIIKVYNGYIYLKDVNRCVMTTSYVWTSSL
jgi:hypothetical protein